MRSFGTLASAYVRKEDFVSIRDYVSADLFESLEDMRDLVAWKDHPAFDAVAFTGSIRKHPYDPEKCIILLLRKQERMPWLSEGEIIELRIRDIQGLDELPSSVDDRGTAWKIFKIWVRRGAIAVRFEPFEVSDREYHPFSAERIWRMLSSKEQSENGKDY